MSAFLLPSGPVQVAFSGGRTSAYMLHALLEANHGLPPDRAQVIFTNTGREMPATLDFVAECGERWGVPIVWLEYRRGKPGWADVGHNSASRNGEPFAALIDARGFLPNAVTRFCTSELKVRPAARYLRGWCGWERWTCAVGIRADEAHRAKQATRERWTRWHPLVDAGVTRADVAAFWARQPFDLRLPHVDGRASLGNCDGCFLKAEATLAALARDHPERHAWWVEQERRIGATFHKGWARADLGEFVDRQGELAFAPGVLCQSDGGECLG